jgi:hypothetical protein
MDGMVGGESVAPDLMEPVLGFKVLKINEDGVLRSPYYANNWEEREAIGRCLAHPAYAMWGFHGAGGPRKTSGKDHPVPDLECGCGLYSFYELSEIDSNSFPIYGGLGLVCITTSKGRIAAHRKGFRAEWQRIEVMAPLWRQNTSHTMEKVEKFRPYAQEKANEFDVPLIDGWGSLTMIAEEMGLQTIPPSLRPSPSETS